MTSTESTKTTKTMFYTDPLKAAWMAREFGVEFQIKHNPYGKTDDVPRILKSLERMGYAEDEPLYIHPDSYSIFEPIEGDLVKVSRGKGKDSPNAVPYIFRGEPAYDTLPRNIIQRNNTAFFMPEREIK